MWGYVSDMKALDVQAVRAIMPHPTEALQITHVLPSRVHWTASFEVPLADITHNILNNNCSLRCQF